MRLRKRDRIVPNKVCAQSGAADTRNRLGRLTDLLLPCGSGAMVWAIVHQANHVWLANTRHVAAA
ncbi:MAG TPA: hypothetical protein VKE26_23750, partial [Xanthobacteraceae bacterium]|nr:hypothetical protein [Xanthobacteraceae bacterium]